MFENFMVDKLMRLNGSLKKKVADLQAENDKLRGELIAAQYELERSAAIKEQTIKAANASKDEFDKSLAEVKQLQEKVEEQLRDVHLLQSEYEKKMGTFLHKIKAE